MAAPLEPLTSQIPQAILSGNRAQTRPANSQERDPFDFLAQHEGEPRFLYWADGSGVAGAGVALELTSTGAQRFQATKKIGQAALKNLDHERVGSVPAGAGPRLIGGFAFSPNPPEPNFPGARFFLPRTQLTTFKGRFFVSQVLPTSPSPVSSPRPRGNPSAPTPAPESTTQWETQPDFDEWANRVRAALRSIHEGAADKVVLARTLSATPPRPPDPVRLVRHLAHASPASRTFLFEPTPGLAFLGSSPELLVQRTPDVVRTVAIAGSRPRGRTDQEDEALARNLLSSSKDAWEHELVCRFLRDCLTRRGRRWSSPLERGVLKLPNIQHLETRFETTAGPGEHLLDFAEVLHPTPAVAGFPQQAAVQFIQQLEPRSRGWYAGPVGWFDADGYGELVVALRTALIRGTDITLHAGCGLVSGSDPAEEWEESRSKFQLLIEAIAAQGAAP